MEAEPEPIISHPLVLTAAQTAPRSETRSQADGHWQKATLRCALVNAGDTDMGLMALPQ